MSAAEEQQPLIDVAVPDGEKEQLRQLQELQDEGQRAARLRHEQYRAKVEQARAPVSPWKRVALLLFVFALFFLAFRMRAVPRRSAPVVHAERYSKQFKYRPAASPIVTSKLPDGRTRIRGADVERLRAKQAAERKTPTTTQARPAAKKKSTKKN